MPNTDTPTDEQIREAQLARLNNDSREWYGVMTVWNAEAIAKRLQRLLAHKRYTFVAVNNGLDDASVPDVRASQQLNGHKASKGPGTPENISFSMLSENHAHIVVCDTYGVWGISSTSEDPWNHDDYKSPYVHFSLCYGNKFSVVHRAPAGHILRWVVAVEESTEKGVH